MPAATQYETDLTSRAYHEIEETFLKEYQARAALFARHWAYYAGEMLLCATALRWLTLRP